MTRLTRKDSLVMGALFGAEAMLTFAALMIYS